jgi:aryl-alcohol dehydrogenase-like predicted oxidoreductase
VGETFSGVPYQVGVETAAKFVDVVKMQGIDSTPAQRALRWIIDQPGVTTVIPGARNQEQARANAAAGSQPPLDAETLASVKALYENYIREHVHTRW